MTVSSFLYPRRVKFFRPCAESTVGAAPYQGLTRGKEAALFEGCEFRAGVQWRADGSAPSAKLPGDAPRGGFWEVLVLGLKPGDVRDRDIVVDDVGVRYQVYADYITPINAQLKCQRLEA